ncbi:Rieske 2Fe-2S domain-containing protein [Nonomuraea sp. SBT364]|uniref:Rieske 2Fe-2S domain-containing protein n=1 Tax=Nonomuraea sp. SBT364 TaxID=1580530 RepID=UPI0007C70445|nr:Rieske 2Fe-2S domain-containing protein [Nonomuraea sp. SBT364]
MSKKVEDWSALDGACHKVSGWVARATRPTAIKNALSGTWLGHSLHPVLTDLPIGAWATASFLDVTAGPAGAESARRLVGVGLIATVPTAAAGASDWSDTYGPAQRAGFVHALCNVTATVMQAASWVARGRGRRRAGMVLSGAGLAMTAVGSYLGGRLSLVHGVGVNHTAFQGTITEWTDVAALSALGDGRPLRVTADGVPVMLVQADGVLHALSATCTHAGGPLDEGAVVGDDCVRCPWHGSVFRLADGKVKRGPATVDAPRWDVKVHDGRVLVRSATGDREPVRATVRRSEPAMTPS